MIIFPSRTTIMFSLKLIFALFMVCLAHFYVFITNSAQTLWQLSEVLLEILRCFSYFFLFFIFLLHPPTESSPRASSLFWAGVSHSVWCTVVVPASSLILYPPILLLLSRAPFFLLTCLGGTRPTASS